MEIGWKEGGGDAEWVRGRGQREAGQSQGHWTSMEEGREGWGGWWNYQWRTPDERMWGRKIKESWVVRKGRGAERKRDGKISQKVRERQKKRHWVCGGGECGRDSAYLLEYEEYSCKERKAGLMPTSSAKKLWNVHTRTLHFFLIFPTSLIFQERCLNDRWESSQCNVHSLHSECAHGSCGGRVSYVLWCAEYTICLPLLRKRLQQSGFWSADTGPRLLLRFSRICIERLANG